MTSAGRLAGRVAIVTGAGRGLGRAHALALAAEGATVVVNDLGGDVHGNGSAETPAREVVGEIIAAGGSAQISGHDVADWDAAAALIAETVETLGRLDVLVNNAGIVRDRSLANMTEVEWDDVIRVLLKGHAAPTRHAVAHWKAMAKRGSAVDASVIMTSSVAGYGGNFGQANYSAAKLAVVALARVVDLEVGGIGVRANTVSPGARTRISMSAPGSEELAMPVDNSFDALDPANVSPLVVWLASPGCPARAQVFHLQGGKLVVSEMPPIRWCRDLGRRWTLEDLDEQLPGHLVAPTSLDDWFSS